jgi:hypothetical protein
MMKSTVLTTISRHIFCLLRAARVTVWLTVLSMLLVGAQAASP